MDGLTGRCLVQHLQRGRGSLDQRGWARHRGGPAIPTRPNEPIDPRLPRFLVTRTRTGGAAICGVYWPGGRPGGSAVSSVTALAYDLPIPDPAGGEVQRGLCAFGEPRSALAEVARRRTRGASACVGGRAMQDLLVEVQCAHRRPLIWPAGLPALADHRPTALRPLAPGDLASPPTRSGGQEPGGAPAAEIRADAVGAYVLCGGAVALLFDPSLRIRRPPQPAPTPPALPASTPPTPPTPLAPLSPQLTQSGGSAGGGREHGVALWLPDPAAARRAWPDAVRIHAPVHVRAWLLGLGAGR
jgi:hypothetical protein